MSVLAIEGDTDGDLTTDDLTSEFSITDDDEIDNTGGTATTDMAVIGTHIDRTP